MNIKDLMIGDWVECDNQYKQITSLFVTENNVSQIYTKGKTCQVGTIEEYIYPIPLTQKILEKNGFKKEIDKDKIHNIYTLTENSMALAIVYARSVFQWFYPIDIKYVHELQHIMKLCGINKEIVL